MGCGCSLPNPDVEFSNPFSSHYQNVYDELKTDVISLSAFVVDSESESSSVDLCDIEAEIRPLIPRSEREPTKYSTDFKRYRDPVYRFQYGTGSCFYPPVHVVNTPEERELPSIYPPPLTFMEKTVANSSYLSRYGSNEHTLAHIAPTDSLELMAADDNALTKSVLSGKISPSHIPAFLPSSISSVAKENARELEGNDSQLMISQTRSMLSISPSAPSIDPINDVGYKIAENLMILRTATNENLKQKTTKREVVPVVNDFITNLLSNSQHHLEQENEFRTTISMVELFENETQTKSQCGFNSPQRDCVSDLNGMQRFELLNKNFVNQMIAGH